METTPYAEPMAESNDNQSFELKEIINKYINTLPELQKSISFLALFKAVASEVC